MITLLMIILILASIILMAVVLMQSSKGNGLAGPIGGSSVTMAFGVRRTSDFLTKATTILAVVIMVGSIAVNLLIANSGAVDESIIQKNAGGQQQMPPTQIHFLQLKLLLQPVHLMQIRMLIKIRIKKHLSRNKRNLRIQRLRK